MRIGMTKQDKVVNAAGALRDFLEFFDEYVISAKDSSGHEVFEETGGSDFNLEHLRDALELLESEFSGRAIDQIPEGAGA